MGETSGHSLQIMDLNVEGELCVFSIMDMEPPSPVKRTCVLDPNSYFRVVLVADS
jgi:hypothetical protein